MSLTPEEFYARLTSLIAEMPDLNNPTSSETQKWLGRASALVQATGDQGNAATFAVCAQNLSMPAMRHANAHTIAVCLHKALAQAEFHAPAAVKGTFIADREDRYPDG